MSIQKLVTYKSISIEGEILSSNPKLELKILDKSANYLIHKDILRHHTLQQQLTASTKTRSEVRGGGKKPWRQKGTGRARAGSSRSPLWKNGGVSFGPKPRLKTYKLNKKERCLALQTLLFNKKDNILIIENLEADFKTHKTNEFWKICQKCGIDLNQKVLFIVSEKKNSLKLAVRNIRNVELILATNLNTLSLIKANQVILTSSSINDIKEPFCE